MHHLGPRALKSTNVNSLQGKLSVVGAGNQRAVRGVGELPASSGRDTAARGAEAGVETREGLDLDRTGQMSDCEAPVHLDRLVVGCVWCGSAHSAHRHRRRTRKALTAGAGERDSLRRQAGGGEKLEGCTADSSDANEKGNHEGSLFA